MHKFSNTVECFKVAWKSKKFVVFDLLSSLGSIGCQNYGYLEKKDQHHEELIVWLKQKFWIQNLLQKSKKFDIFHH